MRGPPVLGSLELATRQLSLVRVWKRADFAFGDGLDDNDLPPSIRRHAPSNRHGKNPNSGNGALACCRDLARAAHSKNARPIASA